ncbi:MAG: hypothetical protein EXS09_20320 [Gemmataceae bacterium]|nr:hypothetical protein [Gemmataceae bacterium]
MTTRSTLPVVGLLVLAGCIAGYFLSGSTPKQSIAADEPKAAIANPGDNTQFGGTVSRNFINAHEKGLSHEFPKDENDDKARVLGSRVKWRQALGSNSCAGPIVADGKIFVGTNNENPRNKRDRGKPTDDDPNGTPLDKGVLMCFEEKTGNFLWQMVHDKLGGGQVHDYPRWGVCSTPTVDGNRIYYTSNRCEVVCLDVNGMADGNQGFQKEPFNSPTDGDVIWTYDMIDHLKVFPHNMTNSSTMVVGDLIFVITANGMDENHINIPFPEAPSFICLNKNTGKLIWKNNLPGKAIMHGQWSNPSYGVVKGKPQVFFPGGDGWLYSLEPETGKLIWKFDANPKDSKYELGGKGTRSDFIASPVVYEDKVYIGTGQDPEHFTGIGHFWCIDATKTGDVSPDLVTDGSKDPPSTKSNPNTAVVWHYGGEEKPNAKRDFAFGRTMSTACIVDGIVYVAEIDGYMHCLDAKTGKKYWQWDTKSGIWGSCYYVDGKILLANENGDLFIFKHEKEQTVMDEVAEGLKAATEAEKKAKTEKLEETDVRKAARGGYDLASIAMRNKVKAKFLLQTIEISEPITSTPVMANGVLYIMSQRSLIAVNPK